MKVIMNLLILISIIIASTSISLFVYFVSIIQTFEYFKLNINWFSKEIIFILGAAAIGLISILIIIKRSKVIKVFGFVLNLGVIAIIAAAFFIK
jgi:hypothetical protein